MCVLQVTLLLKRYINYMDSPLKDFYQDSEKFLCEQLALPHIKPEQVLTSVSQAVKNGFTCDIVGYSFEGRPINLLSAGQGKTVVFAWSQMHGDEPTATAALCDLIALCGIEQYRDWCKDWQRRVTLYLLPMLNPDGAVKKTRVNGQGIDINRDAYVTQSPEGKILKHLLDKLRPDFAFNLHDQNKYYAAGNSGYPATLSFLSPPGDVDNQLTTNRKNAMALISHFVEAMEPFLGKAMAKYQDEYSVRAFGDYASNIGASCILIESGAADQNAPRNVARKMNVLAFLLTLEQLGKRESLAYSISPYEALPLNVENGFTDLLVTGLRIATDGADSYLTDLAIDIDDNTRKAFIREVGDLRTLTGFESLDATGMELVTGRGMEVTEPLRLSTEKYRRFLSQGTLFFYGHTHLLDNVTDLPVIIADNASYNINQTLPKQRATLLLGKSDMVTYAILDGTVVNLRNTQ